MSTALRSLIFCLGLLLATTINAGANGHYRWTDESGTVQYSDRPPEGVEAEFIKFATGKRSKPSEAKTQTTDKTAGSTGTPDLEVMQEKDPELCKQAKKNLKALDATRIRITEPDGTKRLLTNDEKEEQKESARKYIKVHC